MIKENFKYDYITFLEHEEHSDYAIAFFEEFKKQGCSFFLIIDTIELAQRLKKKGFESFICPEEYYRKHIGDIFDIENELKRLSKIFQYHQFRQAIFPETYWFEENEEKFYKRLCIYLRFYEENFINKNISCKYFFQYVGDFIPYYSRKIAARMFSDYVLYCGGYFVFDRFSITPDFHGRWLLDNYDISPTDEEITFIKNNIEESKKNKTAVLREVKFEFKPKIEYKGIKKSISSIFKTFTTKFDAGNTLSFKLKHKLSPIYNYYKNKLLYKSVNLEKEKYIYFPLHVVFDSSLTSMAEPFVDQFYLIELIHRFLPYGYKLLVKEHPAALGTTPYKSLKKISKLTDVIILPIDINSHDIIFNADAVAVINSTAGFEALYYEKPVLTFGNNFYTGQNVTIDVRDLHQTAEKINYAVTFKPDKDKILKMFCRALRESYPIDQIELMRAMDKDNTGDKYVKSVPAQVKAFMDYCEKRLPEIKYKKYLFDV